MATETRVKQPDLYDEDFAAWVEQQVGALRALAASGVVPPELDLPNLIEEVEDLRKTEQRTVESHVVNIVAHLLKLEYSPAADPRRGWRATVNTQRDDLAEVLTPTLSRYLDARWQAKYPSARRRAARELEQDGIGPRDLPERCPYTLDQIRDPDWWPPNRHGLDPSEGGHP
jgi:uncharacterized protein (DUF885 family)